MRTMTGTMCPEAILAFSFGLTGVRPRFEHGIFLFEGVTTTTP